MGANITARKARSTALDSPLAYFAGWELMVTCPMCRDWRTLRIDKLLYAYGGQHKLVSVVNRRRCSVASCKRPPSAVTLKEPGREGEISLVG